MGQHADSARSPFGPRRVAQVCGTTGGIAWVVAYFLPDGGAAATLLEWLGALLLTVALVGLGLLLVRRGFVALRVFVAVALPTLVWGVFALVHESASDPGIVDAGFGAVVGLFSGLGLGRRAATRRATL